MKRETHQYTRAVSPPLKVDRRTQSTRMTDGDSSAARSPLAQSKLEDALAEARALASKSRADSTWAAYASDWRQFEKYCTSLELRALPCSTETLAAFLASQAADKKSPSTIQRRLVAIRLVHTSQNFARPDEDSAIAELMAGIRRVWQQPKKRKAPALADDIIAMADAVEPRSLKGLRDRALLLFGFAGAFRRSELVAIDIADLHYEKSGVRVTIPKSKTDQNAEGHEIAIYAETGSAYCPVQALKDWITVAEITSGAIFLRMHRHDRLGSAAMTPQSVALVVKDHAKRVELEPSHYAGHSLRRGFLTSAAQEHKNIFKMAEHSRHKSLDVLRQYVEDAQKFDGHAGEGLLRADDEPETTL